MSWEEIIKEDIEKGIIKDLKDHFVNYLKSRKFKKLTNKYIREIAGDHWFGWSREKHPKLRGNWPSNYFDSEEWTEAGRVVRTEVETRFMSELAEQWDEIWNTRKSKYLSDVNYVPDDMDG